MVDWNRYPRITDRKQAQHWLQIQENLGLAHNTIDAYARALEDYFRVCDQHSIDALVATREHIALYVLDMRTRQRPDGTTGLANATIHQRLTGVRLFYDFLVEEGLRERNPVGRGSYVPGRVDMAQRGIIPRERKLPWIPTDQQWKEILSVAANAGIRNRTMLAFAYDAALRREELCLLETNDIDPSQRLIRVRAETTKNRQ
jgi:integrase/recombinase XerD